MKCIASFVSLALLFVSSVFCRKEIGRPNINGFYYACYDDGRATLTGTNLASYYSYIIPDYVTYQGKNYQVTMVNGNVFNGSQITKISVHSKNKALLLKKNSLNGVKGLTEFNFNSLKTEPEIGTFGSIGTTTKFYGAGIPYAIEKLCVKYLKKWKLPIGKNYFNLYGWDRTYDLFLLAKNMQRTFKLNNNIVDPNSAATTAFALQGSRDGIARLYRIMAMVMGLTEEQIHVGCDTNNYCWNYVYVDNDNIENNDNEKWHVVDVLKPIADEITMDSNYFQKEKDFIKNTLKPFYNGKAPDSKNYVIHLDVYYYLGENRYGKNMNFDDWISRNNMYPRTN